MNVTLVGTKGSTSSREALVIAKQILDSIRPSVKRASIVGSLLRGHDTVGDLDIVVVEKNREASIRLPTECPIAINIFSTEDLCWEPCFLHYAIGKAIIRLKGDAKSKGWTLNQEGLFIPASRFGSSQITKIDEIYRALDKEAPSWLLKAVSDPSGLYVKE